jgi:iron complex transport system substrate-binding protein
LVNLGGDGGLDEEALLVSGADILTSYPFGDPMQGVSERTGVPVMAFREYAEPHPLGRAEYIKVFGWLTGQEERADSLFDAIAERYNRIRKQGAEDAEQGRPSVFTGSEQGGGWTAPTGDGLVARLVEDAGGHYLLDAGVEAEMGLRREGRNVEMDREQFAVLASGADAWGKVVHAPEGWYTEDAVRDMSWIPLEGKLLFHCNTHEVDYFGQAILEPDRMLSDLHDLFHGDSLSLGGRYFQRTVSRP